MCFAEYLAKIGKITPDQLSSVKSAQAVANKPVEHIIIELGFLSEEAVLVALSKQINLPFVDLTQHQFNNSLIDLLPESDAKRLKAIILGRNDQGSILVGMVDPLDLLATDEITQILNEPVLWALVSESQLKHMMNRFYRRTNEINAFAQDLKSELKNETIISEKISDDNSQTVGKLLQSLFEDAIQIGASDIHIEPDKSILRIRQRVDGILQEHIFKEKNIIEALSLRLKIMSHLDISEKRLPQDGRFSMDIKDKKIDVRLSTLPTEYGESIVMRLLDQSSVSLELDKLGMTPSILKSFRENIHRPYGLILVTGPTGSGKTTTLYSALSELNIVDKKIITVEDPIEYRLDRISQVQVNEKICIGFC